MKVIILFCCEQGIQYGQNRLMWCSRCHQKMSVSMETTRFQKLVASVPEGEIYSLLNSRFLLFTQEYKVRVSSPRNRQWACAVYNCFTMRHFQLIQCGYSINMWNAHVCAQNLYRYRDTDTDSCISLFSKQKKQKIAIQVITKIWRKHINI